MSSRSGWLNHTRDYLKQNLMGKKYFKVHKNLHIVELSPKSVSPINNRRQVPEENDHQIPLKLEKIARPQGLTPDLGRMLKEKDSEIRNLRKLYHEATSKLQGISSSKETPVNLRSDLASSSFKKIQLDENSSIFRPMVGSHNFTTRNKSTQNARGEKFPDFSALNSVRFTKNRPKLVLSSPITGIPLNFPNS
jgi:hypothetical protein